LESREVLKDLLNFFTLANIHSTTVFTYSWMLQQH